MADELAWLESLPLWPVAFSLEQMRELLARLGDPQREFRSVHVVGTNGKGTTTRTIEETLRREGLRAGGYYSPHVRSWAERIRVDGAEADLERALARVREPSTELGATQFAVLTAAAFAEFAAAGMDVAAVEAGLGGRLDATNVVAAPVVVLTNVALEHTEILGDTREAIAREKLAVLHAGATAVLGEPEWEEEARAAGATTVVIETGGNRALGGAAASAFLGRAVEPVEAHLPGRLEWRAPDELWDGAHTPEAVRYIAPQLPPLAALVVSVLGDKALDPMLEVLAQHAPLLVATRSSNPRALEPARLAAAARRYFAEVETAPDPIQALALARAHAHGGTVLVTGSLYLLADLAQAQEERGR